MKIVIEAAIAPRISKVIIAEALLSKYSLAGLYDKRRVTGLHFVTVGAKQKSPGLLAPPERGANRLVLVTPLRRYYITTNTCLQIEINRLKLFSGTIS